MFGTKSNNYPVQLYHFSDPLVKCHLLEPDDKLKSSIYYFWRIEIAPGSVTLPVIPDNAVDLVMSPDSTDFSTFYFPVAERFCIQLEGPIRYIGVCFQLDRLTHFFDLPTPQLRSFAEESNIAAALGIGEIVNSLQSVGDLDQSKRLLDSFFLDRCNNTPLIARETSPLKVAHCIEAMQQTLGDDGISAIAQRFGLSDRHFRRILTSAFGFGPKKVQRIVRLQQALRNLLQAEKEGVLDGYYDDAHRIRELRLLTGMTPTEIRRMAEIYNQLE